MTSKAQSVQNSVYRLDYLKGQLNLLKASLMTGEISVRVYHKNADYFARKIAEAEGRA